MTRKTIFVHPSMMVELASVLQSDDTVEFVPMPEVSRCDGAGSVHDLQSAYYRLDQANLPYQPKPTDAKRWGNNKGSSGLTKAKRKIAAASKRKNRK